MVPKKLTTDGAGSGHLGQKAGKWPSARLARGNAILGKPVIPEKQAFLAAPKHKKDFCGV